MSLSVSENFDGSTAPALPSGWVFGSDLLTTTSQKSSAPNSLTISVSPATATQEFALYNTADTTATTFSVSGYVYLTSSTAYGGVAFNASTTNTSTNSMYHISLRYSSNSANHRVQWYKRVTGSDTLVTQLQPGTAMFNASQWYYLKVDGTRSGSTTSVNVTVQDTITGFYLDNTGNWTGSPTYSLSSSDGSNITPGYFGAVLYTPTGTSTTFIDTLSITTSGTYGATKIPWHHFFGSL